MGWHVTVQVPVGAQRPQDFTQGQAGPHGQGAFVCISSALALKEKLLLARVWGSPHFLHCTLVNKEAMSIKVFFRCVNNYPDANNSHTQMNSAKIVYRNQVS